MVRRWVAALATVLLIAGCAGSGGGSATARRSPAAAGPSVSTSPSPTRELDPNGFPLPERPDCAAAAGGEFVRATTSEGNGVGFLLLGTGDAGVVLGPQSDGDICQWLPYAEELATRYRVALFDWEEPRREVPLMAVEALRDAGARRVVLGGASLGGAYALADAHTVTPRLAGVLSFSGELTLRNFDGRPGIRAWHGPLLALGSEDDGYFNARMARRLAQLHPGPETVVTVPGFAHGVALLDDPAQARVRSAVDRFLARVLG